ncbi:hypothetical protein Enr10x_20580 [Gimesia panareensis]|uniref:Uncharacterized protein n=1 Tax=Gimesia panareensis TaxID=2527978 RepID=A0A517Q534_9PLAN|nr:DUF3592 domain-containing protein [Gimesia panareensis]QDT26748.1 hypothetical protein Enr10x_20580 [Gimesia panareensis]
MITKYVLDDPDTLIRIGWLPGFCLDDLTSWKTQITTSGELTQVIRWHTEPLWAESDNPYFRNRPKRDVRFAQLTEKQMEQLRNTIDALDLEGLRQLQEKYGNSIDDAEEVSLEIPFSQLDLRLPVYSLGWGLEREEADCRKRREAYLQSIIQLEELVNSFAPFSAEKHFQELHAQREKDHAEDERRRLNPSWAEVVTDYFLRGTLYLWITMMIFTVCLIPLVGFYELGKTVWYLSRYESEPGEVVGCHWKETEHSSGYAIVVQTKAGVHLTGSWYGRRENCLKQLGDRIEVLVDPQDRQVAVLNTFIDRWLPALTLLGLTGIGVYFYLKRRIRCPKK